MATFSKQSNGVSVIGTCVSESISVPARLYLALRTRQVLQVGLGGHNNQEDGMLEKRVEGSVQAIDLQLLLFPVVAPSVIRERMDLVNGE